MRALRSILALSVAAVSVATGQSPAACVASDTARALCAVEAALTDALRRNDATRLSSIYADEYYLINYRGRRIDGTGVVAALRSGSLRFDSLANSELQVRIYGAVGVITGLQHQVAREPGGDDQAHPKDVRFTHVFVFRDDRWWLVASQITPTIPTTRQP